MPKMSQLFKRPDLLTKLEVWHPKYSSKYTEEGEAVALLAKYKIEHASPWVLVEFTKAKSLANLRFCIKRTDVMAMPITTNGTIECYTVKLSDMSHWESVKDIKTIVEQLFPVKDNDIKHA